MSRASLMRALVIEDEWPARNYLVELIEASGLAQVVGAVGGIEEARQVLGAAPRGVHVDVAFVDVHLGGETGVETGLSFVRSMAATNHAPLFVLATAHDRHAVEAFKLGVVDYLLKPFSEDRIVQCLRRLELRSGGRAPPVGSPRIVARRKRSLVFLEPIEIWAFEAADRLTCVHTTHGIFDIDLSLAAVQSSFGRAFARVHRNWLVNATHIKELERDGHETRLFVGSGVADAGRGVHVPVARERAGALREMLLANATGLKRP